VKISPGYAIVEMVTATTFAFVFLQHGFSFQTLFYSIFASLLIIGAGIDYHQGIIPNLTITIGLIVALPFVLFTDVVGTSTAIIGLAASGSLMLGVLLISRGGLGMGDVKLAAMIGLYLGLPRTMLGLFLAFAVGAMAGITLVMLNKKTRQDSIAFGPYLAGGALISLLWGETLLDLYARFLLP
jgi:leader peptidase (prepilin peptidase)/N-methyltransferase